MLGLDPGFRTGCKVVCLDAQGNLLHNEAIYPHPPRNEYAQAQRKLQKLVEQYDIQAIAIGNGTASRETESFVQSVRFDRPVEAFVVSEDGASIYSASKIAREEFPEYDVTVRGAVSIGRRLMDPLAELVKIDPKSIGVGQYQHDVDQTKLRETLNRTVESCVNAVGVNLNTASCQLLTYVSGLGPQLAQNIVDYRAENGPFPTRRDLMKVKRMGAKAFEQCAGFLRIPGGENPLDNTAVHPERYALVQRMAKDAGASGRTHPQQGIAAEHSVGTVCDGGLRPSYAERHHERTGQTGARPAQQNKGLFFRSQCAYDGRPEGRDGIAGHHFQYYEFRLFRRHRGARERFGAYFAVGRPLCERPERSRFAPSTGERARAAGGQGTQTDCIIIENLMNL